MHNLGRNAKVSFWRREAGLSAVARCDESPVLTAPAGPSAGLDAVMNACLSDTVDAFGLAGPRYGLWRQLLRTVLAERLYGVARQMRVYDAVVGTQGLQRGGAYALRCLRRTVAVHGQDNLPARGPLLLVSNHPGLADSVALFAQLPRDDLRVIAARRPLLAVLPETARHLFFVPDDASGRLTLVRRAARHMRNGGALLTFPGGRIEPDPAIRPGAVTALADWSPCVDVFARLVPELKIVPVVISGVLSRAALRHPLTRLRRHPCDREWLAATLQMLVPALGRVATEVAFGSPIRVAKLTGEQSATAAVLAAAQRLITACEARRRIDR